MPNDRGDIGSIRNIVIAGLTGLGLGIGGNAIVPNRLDSATEERIKQAKERLEDAREDISALRSEISLLRSDLTEFLRLKTERDIAARFWIRKLNKLEDMHTPPMGGHQYTPTTPNVTPIPNMP